LIEVEESVDEPLTFGCYCNAMSCVLPTPTRFGMLMRTFLFDILVDAITLVDVITLVEL